MQMTTVRIRYDRRTWIELTYPAGLMDWRRAAGLWLFSPRDAGRRLVTGRWVW